MGKTANHEHPWIPWQRYILFLTIDNSKKKKTMGRLGRKDTAAKVANRLKLFKGYVPEIFDTKAQATVNPQPATRNPKP